FLGKYSKVKYCLIKQGERKVRLERDRDVIRFLIADVSFKYKGEMHKNQPRYYYQVRYFGDLAKVPLDRATKAEWDSFWRGNGAGELRSSRHGYVDMLQTRLSHRNLFKTLDSMLAFEAPMPEEFAWYALHRKDFATRIALSGRGANATDFHHIDPMDQSERRSRLRHSRG